MLAKVFFSSLLVFLLPCLKGGCCPIHEKNQEIFAKVIEARLKKQKDPAAFFCDIDLIGKEALQKGLDLSCYSYRINPSTHALSYTRFLLWEGKERGNVIFFLYAWPSQAEALKWCEANRWHKTVIHSHPIPCALTVLLNSITERRYERINPFDERIQLCEKQVLRQGEKAVDLNQGPFIHQLLYEGEGIVPAITLHAYGCPSLEELCHLENSEQHIYPESCIIQSDVH